MYVCALLSACEGRRRWRSGGGCGEGVLCHTSCPWGLSGRVGFGRKREEAKRRCVCVCVCVCRGGAVEGSSWCHVCITEL